MSLAEPRVGFLSELYDTSQRQTWEYFVPSHIAFEKISANDIAVNNAYRYVGQQYDTGWFLPDLGPDGLLSQIEPPQGIKILPPDHHTRKAVEAGTVLVIPNSLENLGVRIFRGAPQQQRGGRHDHEFSQHFFTSEHHGSEMIVSGLAATLDPVSFAMMSSGAVPLPGGDLIGDFQLIMRRQKNVPSSATPWAIVPEPWVQALKIAEEDCSYEKLRAISADTLQIKHWYALPAGRVGLFCGWTKTGHFVFLERRGGYGKSINDDQVHQGVDNNIGRRNYYYRKNLKIKKIKRSQYNQDVGTYTHDWKTLMDFVVSELSEQVYETEAEATKAAAITAANGPLPDTVSGTVTVPGFGTF